MMNKMIALDWRAMKYYQIRALFLPVIALIIGAVYSSIFVIPFCMLMGMSFSVNPFAVEEKGELNNLYLTLPIQRKEIVAGRYTLSLLITFAGILIGIPIMALSNMISFSKWYIGAQGVLIIIALSFLIYSICNIFMFPILFKLGYQKGKIWGFYLPMILSAVLLAGYSMFTMLPGKENVTINLIVYATEHLTLVSGGLLILGIILLLISYLVSVKLYSKRNF